MRNNSYRHLELESQIEGTLMEKDVIFQGQISQKFTRSRNQLIAEDQLDKEVKARYEIQKHQKQKLTNVRSIYMNNYTQNARNKRIEIREQKPRIDNSQLLKVLKNGKERGNSRKNQLQEEGYFVEHYQKNQHDDNKLYVHENSSQKLFKIDPIQNPQSKISNIPNEKQLSRNDIKEKKIKKVINSMKKEGNQKREDDQWKQIENLISNNTLDKDLKKQAKKIERRIELQAAKQMLTGKISIIWIFIIKKIPDLNIVNRIKKMYSGLSQQSYLVPLCEDQSEAAQFLNVPNSLFKIVSDLSNISKVLQFKTNPNIVEFYIYNEEGERGISKALSFKTQSRKVKGIFNSIEKIIERAQQEIQNEIQMYMAKNGIITRAITKRFPSFLRLSGQDKSHATLYRANLYGATKITKQQKKAAYEDFMRLVYEKYGTEAREKKNIIEYNKLNHINDRLEMKEASQVIKFYVRESFYYQVLNSMLRTMKTTEEFKPCILPFCENYHAVKMFYMNDLVENGRVIPPQTLYRGAKLRLRDFLALKPDTYIEMFGFMSTSKNLERAKQFTDRDGYMFIVHVPEISIPKKLDKYDHGFIDINKHHLAYKGFEPQQQVLFNALNIYRVLKIQQAKQGFKMIHLEYGSIFDLLSKDKSQLTSDENDILINYQYCADLLENIEDQGDVFLLANQFEQSKGYYFDKIKADHENGKYYFKLANVQQQCGQLVEADKNVKISLELQLKDLDLSDREKCLKVFSIHSKNAEISIDKEDYLDADQAITHAIDLLSDEQLFEKAKKIRERGQIKFKKGEIKNAYKDFEESQKIFKYLTKKAEEQRKKINRGYFLSVIALLCSSQTQAEIEEEKEEKLREIASIEKQIQEMKDQINQELIRVNNSVKEVAIYADDKEKYEICIKKARAYLLEIKERQTNDPRQKARLKALQATIQDYLSLAESQILLQQAVELVQSQEPFDPSVGKYCKILANLQKQSLQKNNSKGLPKIQLTKGMQPIKYNDEQHDSSYMKCRKNYQKALNILLYNHKTNSSPEVLIIKNQIGQLDYNESNYINSEKIIKEVKEATLENQHSQVSKSCLLLSKISLARGELKDAFENVNQSENILRKVIIKDQQQKKYQMIFENNELYRQLVVHRAKIYMKQAHHDLSIRQLHSLEKILQKKQNKSNECQSILADLYQLQAENIVATNSDEDFQDYFIKAIKLRERQMGRINVANAVTFCNYAKYMTIIGYLKQAQALIERALEIFACFSQDHPITWLVLYCSGLLNEKQNNMLDSIRNIEKSILMARRKFDRDHITINKIRFQYAAILHKAGHFDQAIQQFQTLEYDLQQGLAASQGRHPIFDEKDDEKVTIKRSLYRSMKQSYQQIYRLDRSEIMKSKLGILRIQQKIEDLRNTYKLQDYD